MNSKLYNLSINILEKKNIEYDIEICIWILEKINTIESKQKIVELYINKIYTTDENSIINLLQTNITTHHDKLSKYYLAYIYMLNAEYDNSFLLLKDINIINDFKYIYTNHKINIPLENIILFIGVYLIDKNIDIQLGKKYISHYFSNKKLDGIHKYILYTYCNEGSIYDCYKSDDLFSCYYLGHHTQNILYFAEFIKKYSTNFYIINYISVNNKLTNLLKECQKYIDIHKLVHNYMNDDSFKEDYDVLLEQTDINNEIILIQYVIGLAGLILNLSPTDFYFKLMNNCNNYKYLDSSHYLGIMYNTGFYVKQNYKKALALFEQNNSKPDNFYYLIELYNRLKDYDKSLLVFTNNMDNICKLNKKQMGDCYYIISTIYFNKLYLNVELGKKYLELALNYNNTCAQYDYATYHESAIFYKKDMSIAVENYMLAANNNYSNAISKIAYFYCYGLHIEKNEQLGLQLWLKLEQNNNTLAIYYLAEYYKNIDDTKYHFYINKSIALNNINAINSLAHYYKNKQNMKQYIHYLELYSTKGNVNICKEYYELAHYYKNKQNMKKYIHYLELYSTKGNVNICNEYYELAHYYKNKQNMKKYIHYLELYSTKGNVNICNEYYELAHYYKNKQNMKQYKYFLELASDNNNSNAVNELIDYNKLEYFKNT